MPVWKRLVLVVKKAVVPDHWITLRILSCLNRCTPILVILLVRYATPLIFPAPPSIGTLNPRITTNMTVKLGEEDLTCSEVDSYSLEK